MTLASHVQNFLLDSRVNFELVPHETADTMIQAARRANVPVDHVAKSVVIRHVDGYALAVVPCDRNLDLKALQDHMHYRVGLASEDELSILFDDCAHGAVPPVGLAYGLPTVVDRDLFANDWIWFEGGDHRTFVKTSGPEFRRLMEDAEFGTFSCGRHLH